MHSVYSIALHYLDEPEPDDEDWDEEAVVHDGEESEIDGRALTSQVGRTHVHEERGSVAHDAHHDDDRRHVLVDSDDEQVKHHLRRAEQTIQWILFFIIE